ncbi:MAG: helix-turn-helix transcriptional regulator [Devosia sp.]
MDEDARIRRQEHAVAQRLTGSLENQTPIPEPPVHLHGMDQVYIMCRFDPADVRRKVPAQFNPAASNWGLFSSYRVDRGWGVAPFNAFYSCFEIEGYDSPEGLPCVYLSDGYYSDRGFDVWRNFYKPDVRPGWGTLTQSGDMLIATGGTGDTVLARFGGRPKPGAGTPSSGVNRYAGPLASGGFHTVPVNFSCHVVELEDAFVEITPEGLAAGLLQPIEITWPVLFRDNSATIGIPVPIADGAGAHESALALNRAVDLFGRMGRAALVVDFEGRVSRVNALAESMGRQGIIALGGGLTLFRGRDQIALDRLIGEAAAGGRAGLGADPILVEGGDGRPLLVQALALESNVTGQAAVLLLLTDPGGAREGSAAQVLQLLGLSPAESRLAATVGTGTPPRDAATVLGITESTARSSIKTIYGKLGINRQIDLARIVTRLEGIV